MQTIKKQVKTVPLHNGKRHKLLTFMQQEHLQIKFFQDISKRFLFHFIIIILQLAWVPAYDGNKIRIWIKSCYDNKMTSLFYQGDTKEMYNEEMFIL